MIDISFLNVGQGDSIVFRWDKESGVKGTAIIDCNTSIEGNKTINYLKENHIKDIDYIILSHPHYDHYSGMVELLNYCIENKIKVSYFLFTGKQQPEYIRRVTEHSPAASNDINRLFTKILNLEKSGFIEYFSIEAGPNCDLPLQNSKLKLTILSPTAFEERKFIKSLKPQAFIDEDAKNHPSANWLSTVLKLHTEKWYILFTADCYKDTLIRLDKNNKISVTKVMKIGQSAHHGASSSHNNTFWTKRMRDSNSKAIFSVGANSYGHPHVDSVDCFESNGYIIHSTNRIGRLAKIAKNKSAKKTMAHLATFSTSTLVKRTFNNLEGDQTFKLDMEGNFI